jgi:hypothetical protein
MTVLIKRHAKARFGNAVFYTFALLVGSTLNAVLGTGAFLSDTVKQVASIDFKSTPSRTQTQENLPIFDVSKGGDRFFVLNFMNSVADHRCTINVMKQDLLNKPGSPCQSYGNYLVYTKMDGDRQIVLGVVKGRYIETKAVIVPNEWHLGEWRVAAVPGFDWAEAAEILSAGNTH